MYCRLPNFVSWKRIDIVILPNSVDFLVVKVRLAYFCFLKSEWLLVYKTSGSSRLLAVTVLTHWGRNVKVYFVDHQCSGADWKHTKIQIVLRTYRLKRAQSFLWKHSKLMQPTVRLYLSSPNDQGSYTAAPLHIMQQQQ